MGDQIKNEMGRACNMHGNRRGANRVLVKNLGKNRPLGRPRHR